MKFHATILRNGKTATGIRVPDEVLTALGSGRRPPIRVTLSGYTYRTTVGSVDGVPMFGVSAEVRKNAGVSGDDELEVDIELDTEPREVTVPDDFRSALAADPDAGRFFEGLSHSYKSAYVLWIESAKKAETRERRIPDAISMLKEGRKQR